jgi:hypothetical protein
MTIPFSRYVAITSGVGASVGVSQRDLIGRLFTSSVTVSPNAVLEFEDAASVGDYFGTASAEYRRAAFYFAYQSPTLGTPRRLSFARYSPTGNAPQIFGGTHVGLSTLQLATAGAFVLSFDGVDVPVTSVNLSGAASFAAVATLLTTAIQATATANTTSATVTYDAVNQRFVLNSNVIANVGITVEESGTGNNNLSVNLGWTTGILVDGVLAQSVSDAFNRAENLTNNFGSFSFIPALTITEHAELAALNAGRNVMYQYYVPVSAADSASWSAALIGFAGTGITLSPTGSEYPELLPMAILAATDYGRRNAVVTYMFKQSGGLTPSVTTGTLADTYDALRINYYGRTQTAGQFLDFYQRGLLCGGAAAPVDMNVYANEQWMKDSAGSRCMSLLLSAGRVPANASGRSQILAVLQSTIDDALFNGVISVGKTLTNDQKVFVTQQSGDPLAWYQVQNVGYWVDARIVQTVGPGNTPEYKAVYILIYSKDDAIRKIEGTHALV